MAMLAVDVEVENEEGATFKKIGYRFTQDMDCDADKLLVCIEARPAIYDFTMKEYANRVLVDKLWEEIANEMQCPVPVCKAKWTSLRNSYNRAVRECHNAGPGGKGGKRKRWYMMDAMSFLRDFVGVYRKGDGNSNNTSDGTEFNEILIDPNDILEENSSSLSPSERTENAAAGTRHKRPPPSDTITDQMLTLLKSRNSKVLESALEDPTLTFFKSLVPDVNKLSESRRRKFKLEVFSMLVKELEEEERLYLYQAAEQGKVTVKHEVFSYESDDSILEGLSKT